MKRAKVGICGFGVMGKNHYHQLKKLDKVDVATIYDPKGDECNGDYSKFLKECKHLDGLIVSSPTNTHVENCVQALDVNPNLFILLEKPVDTIIERARDLLSHSNRILVGHLERFNPVIKKVKQMIDEGQTGKIISVNCKRVGNSPSRESINVYEDLTVHDIDLCLYLLANQARESGNRTRNVNLYKSYSDTNIDLCDYSTLTFNLGDCFCILESSWLYPYKLRQFEILSEFGQYRGNFFEQSLLFCNKGGEEVSIEIENQAPLEGELEHFISCIQNEDEPSVTVQDSINTLQFFQ